MRPSVVALGPEDFVRGLVDGAGPFTAFLRNPQADLLPFLASNAVIREHASGLNAVKSHGLVLEIDKDVSLTPTDTMTIACGHTCPPVSQLNVTLEDLGPVIAAEPAMSKEGPSFPEVKSDDHGHLTVDLTRTPLLFGRNYCLEVRDATANLTFGSERFAC